MNKTRIAEWSDLSPLTPTYALVANVDLVIVRWEEGENVSVLYGRCQHRGALLADGTIRGEDLICGVHDWDYRYKTGVSGYNDAEKLHKFQAWVVAGGVHVDADEIARSVIIICPRQTASAPAPWGRVRGAVPRCDAQLPIARAR